MGRKVGENMECGIRFGIPTILKLPRSITRESVKGIFAEILER